MSNREDYLDSLLKSVTGPEEKKERKSSSVGAEPYEEISLEDEFLMKYDQELLDMDEDEFLKEFESTLDFSEYEEEMPDAEEQVSEEEWQNYDSIEINTMDQKNTPEMDYDSILASAGDSLFEANVDLEQETNSGKPDAENVQEDISLDGVDSIGLDDVDSIGLSESLPISDQEEATTEEADIDAILQAALGTSNLEELGSVDGEEAEADGFAMDDAELLDILSGMTEDSDLAEIGNILKAHDGDELLTGDELDGEEIELSVGDEASENTGKKGKKKRSKKKGDKKKAEAKGGKGKLATLFFGEDEVNVPEVGAMGSISDENMDILKDLEKDEKKKQKKEKKEQKKEKKEQKKKEKEEKKKLKAQEEALKPKKEKKPKKPKEVVPKGKPLPKGPVFLIFLMVASVVVLIYLGSTLVGYSTAMTQAEDMYDKGEYVEAYHLLRGMEIKEIDQEFYDKTRLTAYLQNEMDSYEVYIERRMYPDALNSLIHLVGKYDKYAEEAAGVGASAEYEQLLAQAVEALEATFQSGLEEAEEIYAMPERDEYTARLYEILERAGYTE